MGRGEKGRGRMEEKGRGRMEQKGRDGTGKEEKIKRVEGKKKEEERREMKVRED